MKKFFNRGSIRSSVDETHVIPDEQHGFRTKHGAILVHQLMKVIEFATDGFNRNQSTGAIFLNVGKVFNRVWLKGLVYKMHQIGVSAHIT